MIPSLYLAELHRRKFNGARFRTGKISQSEHHRHFTIEFFVAGAGLERRDLWVMSPTSYQLLHPATKNSTKHSLRGRDSNSRQFAYKATALPTELPRKERSIRWPSDSPHMEETEMPPRLPRITPRPSVREGFTTACGDLAFTAIPYSGRDIANGHRPVCLVPGITWC